MAVKRKKRKASTKRKISMRKPRRRTRRKTLNYTLASPRRRTRRRRKTSLSAGPRRAGIMKNLQSTALAGFGGLVYLAPKVAGFKTMPIWQKATWGILGSIGLNMLKYPTMANGFSGAMFADISKDLFPTFLADSYDLQEAEFVDADTLNDSGQLDENGNPVLISDNGQAYALNENNELEEMGDAYSLQEGVNMNTVSMLPLSDPYSLSDRFGI